MSFPSYDPIDVDDFEVSVVPLVYIYEAEIDYLVGIGYSRGESVRMIIKKHKHEEPITWSEFRK